MYESTTPAPPAQQPYSQQYAPGRWVPAGPQLPKSSGYRVASGIIAIVLGCFLFLPAGLVLKLASDWDYTVAAVVAVLGFASALGSLTSGIVLLAKHRGRRRATPVAVLAFAVLPLLLGLFSLVGVIGYTILFLVAAVFSIPLIIVMGIGLAKEKRVL